jgi:HK97 family phage major capsid protein
MRWAMLPEKLEAMIDMLEARARLGRPFTDEEIAQRVAGLSIAQTPHAAAAKPIRGKGGVVAILPLTGIIAPKASMVNGPSLPQGTACESFAAAFDEAMANEDVTHIVIDVDSPGGCVDGVPELAARIADARGKKPITAVANGMAASAAYWIASAADQIVVAPSGEVGSIGVYMVHFDFSEQLAQEGVTPTIIRAGQYKAEGNPLEPLTPEAKAYAQEQIDEYYAMFVGAVAKHRNVSKQTVLKDYGQGRMLLARNAVAAGVADRIGTLESVLGKLGISNAAYLNARRGQQAEAPDLEIAAGLATAAGSGELELVPAAASDFTEISVPVGSLSQAEIESILRLALGRVEAPPTAGDAAPAILAIVRENQPAPTGQENTVAESATASPGGAATNVSETAIAAERKRAQEIRKLCREHRVDDANVADELVDSGVSVDVAARRILDLKRDEASRSPHISVGADRAGDRPFATLGDQLIAVFKAGRSENRALDPRLQRMAAASGMSEGIPADGGFAVQSDFAQEIFTRAYSTGEVLSRCRKVPIGENSNGLKINAIDESSRVNGSRMGGVQVFWANEADTATAKKPTLRQMELTLRKLIGLWYVTDENLQDSTALTSIANDAFAQEVQFVAEDAIFNGTGVGQPQGIVKSAALITQAKEGGQAATTFVTANAAKMYGRLWARSMKNAAWFVNQDVYQQLLQLTIGSSQWPVWIPPGGLSAAPYGSLYGRPVVPLEYMQTLGTVGDVVLGDLSQYLVIDKGGPQLAQSMHVRFINDETAFRITFRIDGQPIWNVALTPKNGTNTLSPFIALQAR